MTPNDLIILFREESDDIDTNNDIDTLWKESQIMGYLNDALNEALWRVPKLFTSSTTAGITNITLVIGTSSYALDARVQSINWARISGVTQELAKKMSLNDIRVESGFDDWYAKTGTPTSFWENSYPHTVNLYPIPVASGTLTFEASLYYPEITDSNLDTTMTFPLEYQRGLVHWMLHRAYSVKDGQSFDPKLAQDYEGRFTRMFGPRKSAIVRENLKRYNGSDAHSRPSWV